MDPDRTNNGVEKNESSGQDRPVFRVGRHEAIDDESLLGSRDHLHSLLDKTWGDVGWKLQHIKTPADVRCTLEVWQPYRENHVVDILLRPSESRATAKELRDMRGHLSRLNLSLRDANESQQLGREFLEQVDSLPEPLSKVDQRLVIEERCKIGTAIAVAE